MMYREISKLVLYGDQKEDSILIKLANIFRDYDLGNTSKENLIQRIYLQVKRVLDISTMYGFDYNLWHNYLTFLLITDENSFSLTCEKVGASEGSVNHFAENDFRMIKQLFNFDFSSIEVGLGIDCFRTISHYQAIEKKEKLYNKNVSERVQKLSKEIEKAKNEKEIFEKVTAFYKKHGVGMLGLNKAFRVHRSKDQELELVPINNTERILLSDLIGYTSQKRILVENTEAFLKGKPANNVLLYGDSGTGKSASIKAIINGYYDQGLRMIELYKHQFQDIPDVISKIKNRNYYFILFLDDLSFEEFEIEYKYLKALIEGGLETKPDNVLIYATSNRRHLVKELWNDRADMNEYEVRRSDTLQEKISLADRFGICINYSKPNQEEYFNIVLYLADKYGIQMPKEELLEQAHQWELAHGGFSGRTAQQFINHMMGKME